jgi:hypothetical protein
VGFVARGGGYCNVANRIPATHFRHDGKPSKLTDSLQKKTRRQFKRPPNIEMEPTLLTVRAIMSPRSAAHFAR